MFPAFHLFFRLGVTWTRVIIFLLSPFSSLRPWASWLLLLLYHFTMPAITLPSFRFVGLWVAVSAYFPVNFLLKASQTHFSHLFLSWALLANILVVQAHFIILFLGFSLPIYYLFASFTLIGFLLDPLGFFSSMTMSLFLITSWVYWPLSRPIELTNSFPRLPWPIHSLSLPLTIPMNLLLHFLVFLVPLTLSLPFFILVSLLAINLVILTY